MGRVCEFDLGGRVVDLVNDERYSLDFGWRPAVTTRRQNWLGGRSLYNDVAEQLPVRITGGSAEEVHSALQALGEVLEQADRYWQTEIGTPVVWRFRSRDSVEITPFSVMILRSADAGGLGLNGEWLKRLEANKDLLAINVTLNFWRRGLWVGPDDTLEDDEGVSHPNVDGLITFPNFVYGQAPYLSPVRTVLTMQNAGANSNAAGYFFLTNEAASDSESLINLRLASDSTPLFDDGGTGTQTADSTAIGGQIIRFIPNVASITAQDVESVSDDSTVALWHWFIKLKNNSATETWVIDGQLGVDQRRNTPLKQFSVAPATNPTIYYLGLSNNNLSSGLRLTLTPSTQTGLAADALDIESVITAAAVDCMNIVRLSAFNDVANAVITIDPQSLEGLTPITALDTNAPGFARQGDIFLQTCGHTARALFYATSGDSSFTLGNGVSSSLGVTVTRRKGYTVAR